MQNFLRSNRIESPQDAKRKKFSSLVVCQKSTMPNDHMISSMKASLNYYSCNRHRRSKRRRFTDFRDGDLGFDQDFYLPEWLMIELLCRVPVKSTFRFRCVSKQWLSILSDPSFPSYYMSRALPCSVPPRCPWFLIFEYMHVEEAKMSYPPVSKLFTGDLLPKMCAGNLATPDFYYVIPLPTPHKAKEIDVYFIKAMDNGFLLYCLYNRCPRSDTDIGGYYICNPITKQWLALPATAPEYLYRRINVGFVTQVEAGQLTSYKVVLVNCPLFKKRKFLEFYIFSSETGEWAESRVYCELEILLCSFRRSVVLNGTLLWIECDYGIVAYDPYNSPDKFRIIPFPLGYSKVQTGSNCTLCDVHQGRLKYFEATRSNSLVVGVKVWELKDYYSSSGGQCWSLQHTVRIEDVIVPDVLLFRGGIYSVKLVGFHPYDPDVVYLNWTSHHVVSYNMQTRRVEEVVYIGERRRKNGKSVAVIFCPDCFMLVHPLWPISIPPSLLKKVQYRS